MNKYITKKQCCVFTVALSKSCFLLLYFELKLCSQTVTTMPFHLHIKQPSSDLLFPDQTKSK